jgi:hypothetical protein
MLLPPKSFVEPDTFYCKRLRRRLAVPKCIGMFVDANALRAKTKPCFGCNQGQNVREQFSTN